MWSLYLVRHVKHRWLSRHVEVKQMLRTLFPPTGDVSSNMDTFRSTLVKAKETFDAVVIAIGNHDLWVSSTLSAM